VRKKDEMTHRRRVLEQEEVNDDDLGKYRMLKELKEDLTILKKRLGYGEGEIIRKECEAVIKQLCKDKNEKYNSINNNPYYSENKYYNQLKKLYSEISSEMKLYKKLLNRPITFKNISK